MEFGVVLLQMNVENFVGGQRILLDLRDKDNPLHVCPCGSKLWNVQAMFEDYEISFYFLEMSCALCGSLATAPTPVDRVY